MTDDVTLPLPLAPKEAESKDERRLWVGNLDSRLREYQLLKLVENFGPLVEFDFLYHRSGPQNGQPRGYAFVTFKTSEAAKTAMACLDGKIVLGRRMAVKWAHAQDEAVFSRTKEKPTPSILSAAKGEKMREMSKKSKIAALEAKLKLLEEDSVPVKLAADCGAGTSKPTSITYAFIEKKTPNERGVFRNNSRHSYSNSRHPYQKRNTRKF